MAASDWSVIVFGDSWAAYAHPTWPEQLGARLGARVFNFAIPGGVASGLAAQVNTCLMSPQVPKPGGNLHRNTLVVVHTGGNDFIQKMVPVVMGGFMGGGGNMQNMEILQPNPGVHEARHMQTFLDTMYRVGARHFLVSGVPAHTKIPIFNMVWPVAAQLVNNGSLESLGISPGDPPQLAIEVQASALNERFETLCTDYNKNNPGCHCVFFNEVEALDRCLNRIGEGAFNTQFWDFSMFHPTMYGHAQLAIEAQEIATQAIPALNGGGAAFIPPTRVEASAPPAAAVTAVPPPQHSEKLGPINLKFRNVKGDVNFSFEVDGGACVEDLRTAVVAAAPKEMATPGAKCTLVHKGKVLSDGIAKLNVCGILDGSQVIVVMK